MTDLPPDPQDWDAFRRAAHDLLDRCLTRLENAADHPWQPVPEEVRAGYAIGPAQGDETALARRLASEVMPYATGNTHPRFFGWVHGSGLATGLMSEMVAATMNANVGGRDHGAVYMERAVIDWARGVFGFPEGASGILVTGTSQATVIALQAARVRALGPEMRRTGQGAARLTAYAGASVHSSTAKALELLGVGTENLRQIPDGARGMDMGALRAAIAADRAAGAQPFALVGTAGAVDTGQFDDLDALADVAVDEGLWLHVDGAFGAWVVLAGDDLAALAHGIGRADSLACDFHKWMYVPYDCGLALIRDEAAHRAAFAVRPSYLEGQDRGLAGGDPWFCDYGIDLSRGNRALKVWSALTTYGPERLGAAIARNCAQARLMGDLVSGQSHMALLAPVVSNLCVFTADTWLDPAAQSALNRRIAQDLQLSGQAVFSTTDIGGVTGLRAAIVNHRTTKADIHTAIAAVAQARGT
ncbi:pyridoxal phosphate-dependent decarboxylase family protein [Aestuariicoccus sp. MJ-SS9]|uniref:pyridoxal phosphate-dependent decarboxylase family protein n=1 Tax=Aestuariicoccus sp. MJ-SS9 TaxID=3079855 RepID=UPI0029141206|nr:pyridoxal-dependent decarboxylase [Aestuariicoccus sp. MJ-SS9]MDU8912185.1 pyridoxal-dependent decarboxylase [Aestuariicoccus sp. MJ-SS9]